MVFTVVDLFSGCGGFSEGFKQAGFKTIVANEFWEPAQKTYARNHKRTKLITGDITLKETKEELLSVIGKQKVNVLIGGPPCQAFSTAGKRDPSDPRAKLYKDYLELVEKINPDCFVMENVKGILSAKNEAGENVLKVILKGIERLGYVYIQRIYRASDFGVPQDRERVMIIGFKIDENNMIEKFKEPNKVKTKKTVFDAIDDLKDKKENEVPNHIFSVHTKEFIKKVKSTPVGKSIYQTYCEAFFRCQPNEPSKTVKENHGSVFIHYEKDRVMTPRELARLQSFDDTFIFEGTKGCILKQIGNAVPPKLAKRVALRIKDVLKNNVEVEEVSSEICISDEIKRGIIV